MTAREGHTAWSRTPAAERARVLIAAADWLRNRRLELAALEVRECAKPWPEADGDVCEAIDFLEYYARGAVELDAGRPLVQVPGEHNELAYVSRGVTAVISPWNFPLAIPCGMTAAALATGNAVVLKPAEQSPACGLKLVQALRAGGVPPDAIALLPGEGDVGAALVRDPGVQTIAFTGSLAVGLEIVRTAAEPSAGKQHIKRVVAELGGKNCVLVDSDADLDEAVPAIVSSAFAYAGQKCSAASRVLVHEAIVDQLLERVAGAVRVLVVGQASLLSTDVPSRDRTRSEGADRSYRSIAERAGRIVASVEPVPDQAGSAPPPSPPTSRLLPRGLVGGVRTAADGRADPRHRARMRHRRRASVRAHRWPVRARPDDGPYVGARTPVGNLYVNRGITGAKVGRQPPAEPAVRHRQQGGVPLHLLPVRRAACGDREHDASRPRGVSPLSIRPRSDRDP